MKTTWVQMSVMLWAIMTSGCLYVGLPYARHLREAEEKLRQDDTSGAIESYKKHVEARLTLEERPEWENPYFYYLIIGDLFLREGDIKLALSSYALALEKEVDKALISDRFRYAANWFAEQKRYEESLNLLTQYRYLDELLFDLMADRVAREMARQQDAPVLENSRIR